MIRPRDPTASGPYGLSVDLGTSTISLHVLDLERRELLAEASSPNPQNQIALDLVSRIRFSLRGKRESDRLTDSLRSEVGRLAAMALRSLGVPVGRVTSAVVVGNSVMQNMLLGAPCEGLVVPPYLLSSKSGCVRRGSDLGMDFFGSVQFYFPPLVESFIGSDAVANMLTITENQNDEPTLLLDIGTNTEILLLVNNLLWAASAAAGPAFEGMSLECGMPAISGAIYSAQICDDLSPRLSIIGESFASGICGSGIVSIVDGLRRAGLVNELGSFDRSRMSKWVQIENDVVRYILQNSSEQSGRPRIHISQIDLRMIQQSKAAIQAGILCLLGAAEVSPEAVRCILLTGAFGGDLDLQAAARIGMIPRFGNARASQRLGNALRGADMMLLDPDKRLSAGRIAEQAIYVPLMDNPVFEELYSISQAFRPWISK